MTYTTNADAFKSACIDTNSIAGLASALADGTANYSCADDCRAWDITPAEWLTAIKYVLAEKRRVAQPAH